MTFSCDDINPDETPDFDDDFNPFDDSGIDLPAGFEATAPAVGTAPAADLDTDGDVSQRISRALDALREIPPLDVVIEIVTREFLRDLDPEDPSLTPHLIATRVNAALNAQINLLNSRMPKGTAASEKLPTLKRSTPWQVAQFMLHFHHVILIAPNSKSTDREYDMLAMYIDEGQSRGIYTPSEEDLRTIARRYRSSWPGKVFAETLEVLRDAAPRWSKTDHPDLIAFANGVHYYGTKPLAITINGHDFVFEPKGIHPFHPSLVFTAKKQVDCPTLDDPADELPEVRIYDHVDTDGPGGWEVREWLAEFEQFEGGEGLTDLLWEIIGAVLRPHVRWNKTAWFYSEQGNNGKGTICSLLRNILGPGAHTSIPLSDFGKNFALEPLVRANAIIVDENDVNIFIDKAANLKAVVTGDVLQIDRKFRPPIAYQFQGFMVQCLNGQPQFKDKSESFYRRQLFVPFERSFTGHEKTYIKDDYLNRPEVLEYVVWYAMNRAGSTTPGQYYQLSAPPSTAKALEEYKEWNDPVRTFWTKHRDELTWDLQPFSFLYDAFKVSFFSENPSGKIISQKLFINGLVEIVRRDPVWRCEGKEKKIRPKRMMDRYEPLIIDYELKSWMNSTYKGPDPFQIASPRKAASYRGLLRNIGVTDQRLPEDDESDGTAIEMEIAA